MKIDRLIGIVTILLQKERTTAPELAKKFEVSRRTINRDMEDLCKAGVPLITFQGVGGGIGIAEGYKIDKTLFTSKEMQAILVGLKGLDSVAGDKKYKQIIEKIFGEQPETAEDNVYDASGHILIDLASHYKGTLAPKIELLRIAMEENKLVSFQYYCESGEGRRVIEPYVIVFQWSNWYVWGYCKEKQAFRFFKLNRLVHLNCQNEHFKKRKVPPIQKQMEYINEKNFHLIAQFDASVKWRLIEEYGMESYLELENGKLAFEVDFASKDNLLGWILSFGDKVEIVSPKEIKEEYLKIIDSIQKRYN